MNETRAPIREALDVFAARRQGHALAAAIGFPQIACLEIAIVVSELATNILKYGVRGEIAMRRTDVPGRGVGIELVAEDEGPPLASFATALLDGHEDSGPIDPGRQLGRGGIGAGLGAIVRMTDDLAYLPGPGRKSFRAIRYLRRPRRGQTSDGVP
jgi:anti-sigma regulatory factor (Ser/Thr protein kinase)